MSLPPNIYVPIGHGDEETLGEKPVMPPGCQLVVLAQCKTPIMWPQNEQFDIQAHIQQFIATNPEYIGIFADPVHNIKIINAAIGSICGFYTTGDEYPDIIYELDLQKLVPGPQYMRYSGVIPFATFVSNEEETGFTTKNIFRKVYPGGMMDFARSPKPREIYKYSVFPRPEEFPTKESTNAEMIEFLLNTTDMDNVTPTQESLEGLTKEELYTRITNRLSYNKVNKLKLSTLMAEMPGVYYHLVCRGWEDNQDKLPQRRRKSFVKHRLPGLTGEEIFKYIRNPEGPFNGEVLVNGSLLVKPGFLYENVRNIVGPYDKLPQNIRNALNKSRPFLLPSEGGMRSYKQRRKRRKTRKIGRRKII